MTATVAKANILCLLDEVATGEEIEITRHGRPIARLIPSTGAHSLKGLFAGRATTTVENEEDLLSSGEGWNVN